MAIDAWRRATILGESREELIQALLRREVPPLISWIVRGGCAVQCEHCIFPFEGPKGHSDRISTEIMLSLLAQLSGRGNLVHEGRQLLPWQIPVLAAAKRAGHGVSVINNGQYATPSMLALCDHHGLKVDALDVSIDGPEAVHNLQRNHANAWRWAMNGLAEGRRIADKLTSLFTLTALNSEHVAETGKIAGDLVDEWHLTTMSVRPGIEHMLPTRSQLSAALDQLAGLRLGIPVYLRSYSLQGFVALCEVIGKEAVRKALREAQVIDMTPSNGIVLNVEGINLYFYPKSLQCNETLVVDADGWWRLPFSVAHTLDELQCGQSTEGDDLSHFSIAPVSEKLDVAEVYARSTVGWWQAVGRKSFNEERVAVERLLA
ncbi:radical SAM protein [Candidatus Nomurabacteria bacterium]|nr:radical SAM protein [Candidatus Nomurabacteria bacterium]